MDILKFIPEKILTGIRKKRPSMTDNEILETISSLHPGVIKNTLKISNKDSFKLINELIANHGDVVILSNKEFFKSQNDDASNVSELLTMQTSNRIMDQNKEFKKREEEIKKLKKEKILLKKDIDKKEIDYIRKNDNVGKASQKIKQLKETIKDLVDQKNNIIKEIEEAKNMKINTHDIGNSHILVVE